MNEQLLNTTIEKIKQLDETHLKSVNNFIASIAESANKEFTEDLAKLAAQSKTFAFLNDEPDIYTDADLIEPK